MAAVMASSVLFFAGPTSGRTFSRAAAAGEVASLARLAARPGPAPRGAIRLALGERPQVATVGGLVVGADRCPRRGPAGGGVQLTELFIVDTINK